MYRMNCTAGGARRVPLGIVGRERDFQDALAPFADSADVVMRYYHGGRDVLRRAADEWNAVWIIDLALDDMCAFDLFEMIRDRLQGATVCMVGRDYRADDEVNAYRAGATIYTCRPLQTAWLRRCIDRLIGNGKPNDASRCEEIDAARINSLFSIRRQPLAGEAVSFFHKRRTSI